MFFKQYLLVHNYYFDTLLMFYHYVINHAEQFLRNKHFEVLVVHTNLLRFSVSKSQFFFSNSRAKILIQIINSKNNHLATLNDTLNPRKSETSLSPVATNKSASAVFICMAGKRPAQTARRRHPLYPGLE